METVDVLFLDVDGVLNTNDWIDSHLSKNPDDFIDPEKVTILNRIIQKTGCKCVLSSDWRFTFTAERMQSHLATFGFIGEIIGATEDNSHSRLSQISDWIDNASVNVDQLVILDDMDVVENSPGLKKFQVRTDAKIGLTDADADKAIAILKGKS